MPTLKGFTFKNQTETSADLYFYGDIVSDWWGAWQDEDQYPDAIKNFLSEQEGKDLNIYVNSGGGSVFAGIAIYNMIKRHAAKANVKVYVDGLGRFNRFDPCVRRKRTTGNSFKRLLDDP